jgi:hypothetical protein
VQLFGLGLAEAGQAGQVNERQSGDGRQDRRTPPPESHRVSVAEPHLARRPLRM